VRRSKPEALTEADCRHRAVELLARRDHSRAELERKLAAHGFPAAVIATVLDALESKGLVGGVRFADSFVRTRVAKGKGPMRIRAELAERGIDGACATSALAAEDVDWAEAARVARRKRFGAAVPRDFKERARQTRFLQYRGFDSAQIRAALELADDSD
jgi:regulatory protein